jgi:hypothetical protein
MNSLAFRSTIRFTAVGVALLLAGSLALAAGNDEPDAWLGVFLGARAGEPGILIYQVIEDSPAEAAGMQDKDVIIAFNGVKIGEANDFYTEMGSLRPGDTVSFTALRDGDEVEMQVTLAEREDQRFKFDFAFPDIKAFAPQFSTEMRERGYLGIGTQQMTGDLREYFGAPESEGILINKIVEDSPAEQGGLRAGDVIVEADGETVEDTSDLIQVLQEKSEGDPIQLTIYRDGRSQSLEVICGVTQHRFMDWSGVNPCGDDDDEDCDFHFDFDSDGEGFLGAGYLEGMERLQEYLESEEFKGQMEQYYEKSLQYQDQMDGWREQLEEKLQELEEKLKEMQDKKRTSNRRPAPPPRAALLPSHI